MDFLTGKRETGILNLRKLLSEEKNGCVVKTNGAVLSVRDMGDIVFIILRKRDGILQAVMERGAVNEEIPKSPGRVFCGGGGADCEGGSGASRRGVAAYLCADSFRAGGPDANRCVKVKARLDMRPLTLRNLRERARFKVQEGIARVPPWRGLYGDPYAEDRGQGGAEGGANVFKLECLHRPDVLAQSPQFYKQMMVVVFDRVMEIGPVFRAEKHNTKRHLNE